MKAFIESGTGWIKVHGLVEKNQLQRIKKAIEVALEEKSVKQKAFVIMGNDFPDAIFSNEAAANKYVAKKKEENEKEMKDRFGPKVYWRSYEFEVQQ